MIRTVDDASIISDTASVVSVVAVLVESSSQLGEDLRHPS